MNITKVKKVRITAQKIPKKILQQIFINKRNTGNFQRKTNQEIIIKLKNANIIIILKYKNAKLAICRNTG